MQNFTDKIVYITGGSSGIGRNRFMIIPGTEGKMAYLMKRYAPSSLDKIMQSAIRKVRQVKT